MPNWKKVLLSGSRASVFDITASSLPGEPDKTTDVVVIGDNGGFQIASRNDFGAASGPNKAIQFAYTEDNTVFQNSGSDKFTFDEESIELIISAAGEGQINVGRTDEPSSGETLGSLNYVGTGSNTMEGPTAKIEAVATQDYTLHAKGGKLNFYTSNNGASGIPSGLDLKMTISESGVVFNTNIIATDITASGNISASGNIIATNITASSNISASGNIITNHITASGNISASGDITANSFTGIFVGALSSSVQIKDDISGSFVAPSSSFSTRVTTLETNNTGTNTGDQSLVHLAVTSSNVLFGNITSSGNISASGQLIAGTATIPNMDAAGLNPGYQTVVRNPNTGVLLYTGSYGSGGGGGTGDVSVSGTPSDNQIAVWTDSSTIEGTATLSLVSAGGTPILGSSNGNFEVHAKKFAIAGDTDTFVGSGGGNTMRLVAGGIPQIQISDGAGQSIKLPELASQSSTVSLNVDIGNGGTVGYRQLGSSRKLKKDIIYLDNTSMLTTDDFDKIKPVVFKYKEGITSDKFKGGFIAEDLAEINPILAEFSDKNETNPINIEDRSILALCILKIKELEKEIEYLKTKIS
jgi:hypothetical protein